VATTFVVRLVTNFNSDLRLWNVSAVEDMRYTFLNCFSFEGRGLDAWDTSNVRNMFGMFTNTPSFNGDLSDWNVQRVTSMSKLFRQATSFNSDISRWDVSSVTDLSEIVSELVAGTDKLHRLVLTPVSTRLLLYPQFMHAVSFNADVSAWNTSSVTDASMAFYGTSSFKGDISNWDVRNMVNLTEMVSYPAVCNFYNVVLKHDLNFTLSFPIVCHSLQAQEIWIMFVRMGTASAFYWRGSDKQHVFSHRMSE
jgi:trimeric autotransporter adhesin